MFRIQVITKKGTPVADQVVEQGRCLLGRGQDCDIRLHGWLLSKKHAVFETCDQGQIYVNSLDKKVGVRVHGQLIDRYGPVTADDEFQIDAYIIKLKDIQSARSSHLVVENNEQDIEPQQQSIDEPVQARFELEASVKKSMNTGLSTELRELYQQQRIRVHRELLQQMDLRRININEMSDEQLRSFTQKIIKEIISSFKDLPEEIDIESLGRQVLNEAVGLGPLEDMLLDDSISEIMVNRWDQIFYECNGRLLESDITFTDDRSVLAAIERIVAPIGRRIDEGSPTVDARLKDGSRVNAVIPPISINGPCITIRKFTKEKLQGQHLIDYGSITAAMVEFLKIAVHYKQNVVVSGGTGSGKTTLLNVLSNFIPDNERVITIEDSAELRLNIPNLVNLEARPANQEGSGCVSIRDLVKNCLRMRPDRIVVGECRSGEALDMLQAMNTGHDGSLTTVHANSPRDCISRIEVMVMMAGMDLPAIAIREQIASAVNIIVQQTRFSCGSRKVTSICEVAGVEGNTIQLGEIFRFRPLGTNEQGKIQGVYEATGIVPTFYEGLKGRGIEMNLSIFQTDE